MERLTPKDWKSQYQIGVCSRDVSAGECVVYNECFDYIRRLAELEDKLENGEILIPPCKVGDTVYYPDEVDDGESIFYAILEGKVECFNIQASCKEALVRYDGGLTYWHNFLDFGKKVFTDMGEAMKKLKALMERK